MLGNSQSLIKLNIYSYDSAIALQGMYPIEVKTYVNAKNCTQIVIRAFFTIAKTWDALLLVNVAITKGTTY